jgi:GT2 family glycosyltransferase
MDWISLKRDETSEDPVVSVVIVNYNGRRFLGDCLQSLYAQTYQNLEILVVDNGSSDDSVEYLKSCHPDVIIIENASNLGFAGGVNAGIRHSRGSFICTLNNDTWADCHCIEQLTAEITTDDRTGMCATKMLFPDQRINSTGICLSRSGAAWDRGMFEEDTGQYNAREEIFGPCAGAALYRKKMLDEIGLFDEDFFLYMEDVDLAVRGQLAGWKCIFVPGAVVYHYHGGTAGVMSDLAIYHQNRNILWVPVKNYPLVSLIALLPWMVCRNVGIIFYYILRRKGKLILRSKFDAVKGIPRMWKKRSNIRPTTLTRLVKFFRRERGIW